jgi:hypothetical protein
MTPAMWVTLALLAVPVVLLLATTGCGLSTVGAAPQPQDGEPPPPEQPTYEETVLNTAGLLGYWRLGETSVDQPAVNSKDQGLFDGNYVDPGITLQKEGALHPKDTNTAALFDGTTGHVHVPLIGGLTEVTVELWMKPPTNVAEWGGVLVGCYEPVSGQDTIIATGYRLRVQTSGSGQIEVEANLGEMDSPLVAPVVDGATPAWHHVVLTYSKEQGQERAELYVDGNPSPPLEGQFNVNCLQPLRFGGGNPVAIGQLADPYAGLLDEVALYMNYLDLAEVDKHYTAAKA